MLKGRLFHQQVDIIVSKGDSRKGIIYLTDDLCGKVHRTIEDILNRGSQPYAVTKCPDSSDP